MPVSTDTTPLPVSRTSDNEVKALSASERQHLIVVAARRALEDGDTATQYDMYWPNYRLIASSTRGRRDILSKFLRILDDWLFGRKPDRDNVRKKVR